MARIVHIALKVDDLEKATEFYEKGFGFVEMETGQVRDHTSRHLTDGTIDLALIKYDSEDSAEARASGLGPCIHHFAIEVDDMKESADQLKRFDCEIISDPGVIPIKFRAPGGTVAEIVPKARYKKPKERLMSKNWSDGVIWSDASGPNTPALHYSNHFIQGDLHAIAR